MTLLREEISGAIDRLDLAIHIAWMDTRTRYRRSVLGPFWLVLGTAIAVGGLGFVWSILFEVDRATFIPSLTIGLVIWYMISASVTEGAAVFYTNRDLMLNMPVSSLLVSLTLLFRQFVNFAHNFVVIAAVLLIFPQNITPALVFFVPGLLLTGLCLWGIIHLTGYFGARYRDIAPLLAAIMQPLFFLTPIIFRPEQLGTNQFIVDVNPFAYMVAVIREPLMGTVPSLSTWLILGGMTLFAWAGALAMTVRKRQRLAYWVN